MCARERGQSVDVRTPRKTDGSIFESRAVTFLLALSTPGGEEVSAICFHARER